MKYVYVVLILFVLTAPGVARFMYEQPDHSKGARFSPMSEIKLFASVATEQSRRHLFHYEHKELAEPEAKPSLLTPKAVDQVSPEPVKSSHIRYVGAQKVDKTQSVFVIYGDEYYIVQEGEYIADEFLLERIGEQEIIIRNIAQSQFITIRMEGAVSE